MFETKIAAGALTIAGVDGFPPELDMLAAHHRPGYRFLRAAWYRAAAQDSGQTLLIRRGDGAAIAAIPTVPFGPAIAQARKVPGAYWPFRAALIAPDCDPLELAQALACDGAHALGRIWRLGPVAMDDTATTTLIVAAGLGGWRVLARLAGTAWLIDLAAARTAGWPRPSTAKRLRRIENRLAKLGPVEWQHLRGGGWNDRVLEELGAIEAASWVATETDGSGAKFMTPAQREQWRCALADPVLAQMLCATILRVDGRAVAFSFDLDDGPVRYGIAGSYVSDLARHDIGKLANYRAVTDALEAGQDLVDLGSGDSGYKREMGAAAGYRLEDLLFVRSRIAARVLARLWGPDITPATYHG